MPRAVFSVSLGCEVAATGVTEAESQTSVSNNGISCNVETGPLEWDHTFASAINLDMSVCSVTAGLRPAWTPDLEINDENHHKHRCGCDFKQDKKKWCEIEMSYSSCTINFCRSNK